MTADANEPPPEPTAPIGDELTEQELDAVAGGSSVLFPGGRSRDNTEARVGIDRANETTQLNLNRRGSRNRR